MRAWSISVVASVTVVIAGAWSACTPFNGSTGDGAGNQDGAAPADDAAASGADGASGVDGVAPNVDGGAPTLAVLATDGPSALPIALAADGTSVYWADNGTGTINRFVLATSTSTILVSTMSAPKALVLAGAQIAWDNPPSTSIDFGLPNNVGTTPVQIMLAGTGEPVSMAFAVSTSEIWWTTQSNSVFRATVSDGSAGTPVQVKMAEANPFGIAIDGNDVYWTRSGAASVWHHRLDNSIDAELAPNENDCQSIAAFGGAVYWTRPFTSDVRAILSPGTQPMTIGTGEAHPGSLAADSSGVYWLDGDATLRHWAPGAGQPETLFDGDITKAPTGYSRNIALDASYVYFARLSDGAIMQITKPH